MAGGRDSCPRVPKRGLEEVALRCDLVRPTNGWGKGLRGANSAG